MLRIKRKGINMEKVNRSVRSTFLAALLSTLLFVIGIPMLIIGATHTEAWGAGGTALMIAGIVFSAADFYAAPILWVTYGNRRTLSRVVFGVEKQGLTTVERLASHLRVKEDDARSQLDVCFAKGYLDDYVRDGDTIKKIVPAQDPDEVEHDVECPSCAAKFTYRGAAGKCPYCGTVYRTEEH